MMSRYFRRALTALAVLAFASAAPALAHLCADFGLGLVSHWAGEGDADDELGSNPGVLLNGVGFAPGVHGQAFEFDGVAAYVQIPDSESIQPQSCSFALEGWIRTGRVAGRQVIMAKDECSASCKRGLSNSMYALSVEDGVMRAEMRDFLAVGPGPEGQQLLFGSKFVADDGCHHVAMVRDLDAEEFRVYVDGKVDARAPLGPGGLFEIGDDDGKPDDATIGARFAEGTLDPIDLFAGQVDEVRFYLRPLVDAQIEEIFKAGKKTRCKPPKQPRPGSSRAFHPLL